MEVLLSNMLTPVPVHPLQSFVHGHGGWPDKVGVGRIHLVSIALFSVPPSSMPLQSEFQCLLSNTNTIFFSQVLEAQALSRIG